MSEPVDPKLGARFLPRWEIGDVVGTVVAIDVIRAFTSGSMKPKVAAIG